MVSASLNRDYYVSEDVFELEKDRVFLRNWWYVGHQSQLPAMGDYFTVELLGESVIVVRDAAQSIRAFYNVCRHRGSRICTDDHGHVQRFVCPYHQWAYDPAGRLIRAPQMPPDFSRESFGLKEIPAETWHGLVFINLSEAQVARLTGSVSGRRSSLDIYDTSSAKVAWSKVYHVRANWKLVLENFLECYHCGGSHPEFCAVFDLKRHFDANRVREYGERPALATSLKPGAKSLTTNGEYVVRELFPQRDTGRLAGRAAVGPPDYSGDGVCLSAVTAFPDYAITFVFLPLDVAHTEVRCDWLVAGDAQEGVDYDPEEVAALWDVTNEQDWHLCEVNQLGVQSRSYEPGPHSVIGEPYIGEFLDHYLTVIRE
jgi:phenylpropionate dioxygenase-like ring-hydroxylating dioxygenase large terminal subunit